MYIGQSLDPSGVIKGVQIAEHRLLFPVDIHLTNDKLRHQIAYSKYKDDTIMTNGGITLVDFIGQCKTQNVIPIVNLSFFAAHRKSNWTSLIPPEQYGRCSRIVADLLTENFNLSVIAPLNEPRKWLSDNETGIYTQHAYNSLTSSQHSKIKFSIGNEEYFVSLFQHLGNLFRNKSNVMFGAHLLSSMGTWKEPRKYFSRIADWKNLANSYGLGILNIEGGAWFNFYCTYEGHNINKDIIKISKQNGYWASSIVLIENNSMSKYKRLSYRRYDNDYIRVISEPMMNENISYFRDFINFIKKEGQKVQIIKRSVDGMIMRTIGFKDTDLKSGYPVLLINELLYQNNFLSADKVGYSYTEDTKQGAVGFINHVREKYPNDPVKQLLKSDGRIGRQTYRYLIEEISDPVERKKYQFALEVMCSPINLEGAGV